MRPLLHEKESLMQNSLFILEIHLVDGGRVHDGLPDDFYEHNLAAVMPARPPRPASRFVALPSH
jgi:hypothetical protein